MNKIKSTDGLTEKQIARREYARNYYAAHRDTMLAAVKKSQAKHALAPVAETRPEREAMHAICPDKAKKAKKAAKTPAQKNFAKAQAALDKAIVKYFSLKDKLAAQKDTVRLLKASLSEARALVKAEKTPEK